MKVSESKARLLLALVLNGADQGDGVRVPERRCNLCGSFLVRFEASAGLQAAAGGVEGGGVAEAVEQGVVDDVLGEAGVAAGAVIGEGVEGVDVVGVELRERVPIAGGGAAEQLEIGGGRGHAGGPRG